MYYKSDKSKKEVIFFTSNKNKIKEMQNLISSKIENKISIKHCEYKYPELQLEELELVAKHAVSHIRERLKERRPFIIEDSGLFINALNGFPGPFSSYAFKKIGNAGILRLMQKVKKEERGALFKSIIAFSASSESDILLFIGSTVGRITEEIRGKKGFGYDPIFEVRDKTFGEMSIEEKNRVSHRSKAFKKFLDYLYYL